MADDLLEVDPAALRTLASTLATVAADIKAVSGSTEPLTGVAWGLPGAQTGAACAGAAPRITDALADVAVRVGVTGVAVSQAVSTFLQAHAAFALELRRAGGL